MSDPLLDRVPPHNQEAEQSVIGAIFLEPQALITAAEIIMPEDFYRSSSSENIPNDASI